LIDYCDFWKSKSLVFVKSGTSVQILL